MINITQSPYNCVGDGVTDNTAGINLALAAVATGSKQIYAPAGNYLTQGNHLIQKDGQSIVGDGIEATIFTVTQAANCAFKILNPNSPPDLLTDIGLKGFSIRRQGEPAATGVGIDASNPVYRARFESLLIEGHQRGMLLGNTDYSIVRDVIVQRSRAEGVYHRNNANEGACQYTFEHCLFQINSGHGYKFDTQSGPLSVSLGEFVNVSTYANTGSGLQFIGTSATPIQGIRIVGGFFGEDADTELYLDTWGGYHKIVGTSIELTGSARTGHTVQPFQPTSGVDPSHAGVGIMVLSHDRDVLISGVRINNVSSDGIYMGAALATITGCNLSNNGANNALTNDRNGVKVFAGSALVTGNTFFNYPGTSDQKYGVMVAGGAVTPSNYASLNQFSNNSVAPTSP